MKTKGQESLRDKVLKEYKDRNIVFAGIDGLQVAPIDEFIKQPEDGILYDLNRDEAVILTFIDDPKWVNDFAVCKTIRVLRNNVDILTQETSSLKAEIERLKEIIGKQEELIAYMDKFFGRGNPELVKLIEELTKLKR